LRQQHDLHAPSQTRAVGLVVHLAQAIELPPANWLEFQWLPHGAPGQKSLPILNHASAAKSKIQNFFGFI
jgi:hypothetical protein